MHEINFSITHFNAWNDVHCRVHHIQPSAATPSSCTGSTGWTISEMWGMVVMVYMIGLNRTWYDRSVWRLHESCSTWALGTVLTLPMEWDEREQSKAVYAVLCSIIRRSNNPDAIQSPQTLNSTDTSIRSTVVLKIEECRYSIQSKYSNYSQNRIKFFAYSGWDVTDWDSNDGESTQMLLKKTQIKTCCHIIPQGEGNLSAFQYIWVFISYFHFRCHLILLQTCLLRCWYGIADRGLDCTTLYQPVSEQSCFCPPNMDYWY